MKTKISLTQFILEKINEAGQLTLNSMFPRGRAESRIWRTLLGLPESYEFSPHTFSVILSRLSQQGLVVKKGIPRKTVWAISRKGAVKLNNYPVEFELPKPDGLPRLVVYDIPELEKAKREWFRGTLVSCGYKQLQRSVWLGYCPLPERLIRQIHNRGLKNKIHIVGIHKSGTLEYI